MEREQILKVMVPVGAFAALLLVIGLVIAFAGGGGTGGTALQSGKVSAPPPPAANELGSAADDGTGMVRDLPPTAGPEWKETTALPGLKVWDVSEGTEDVTAAAGDSVKVRYTGWLAGNGVSFDGGPDKPAISFGLDRVIAGWTHGIPGMKVGGVRRLYIPAQHAYGSQDKGKIPPNSDLVFEVKLIRVVRP